MPDPILFKSGKTLVRLAVIWVCLALTVLPADAEEITDGLVLPLPDANVVRLDRVPPANFRNVEIQEETGLWWSGEAIPGILFLAGRSEPSSPQKKFTLVPGTAVTLRNLLLEIGIEANSARAWSEQKTFSQDDHACLVLATNTGCVEMRLASRSYNGKTYLEMKTDDALAARYGRVQGYSLIGSSQFSIGTTHSKLSEGRYLGASTRGVASRGRISYEYDLGYSYSSATAPAADSTAVSNSVIRQTANYRLLVAGLGFANGGRAYAGTFGAAFGNLTSDGGSQFFSHPALLGVAYRSRGSRLSNFGAVRRVRLMLQSESQVRITSSGVELFNAIVPPGDQTVEFQGYPEPFVDVSIRNPTGLTRTERVEVIESTSQAEPGGSNGISNSSDLGEFYLDAGRLVDSTNTQNTEFKTISAQQLSMYYTRWLNQYSIGAGVQSIGDRRRISSTLSGPLNRWRVTAMLGNGSETGLGANVSFLEYGPIGVSFNATRYRPPANSIASILFYDNIGSTNAACQISANSLCFQNTPYDSFGFNVGYRGFPIRLGYLEFNTPFVKYAAANLTGTYNFELLGHAMMLIGYLSRDLNTKITSFSVSLSAQLDSRQTVVTSLTGVQNGARGISTSYTRIAEAQSDDHIRSLNLSAAASSPTGDRTASAYMQSQLGAINNTTGISSFGNSGYGVSTTVAVGYAANNTGLAYSDTGYASVPTGLFSTQGSAALALINESLDLQTFKIGESLYAVKPRSSRLIDRNPGALGKWSVSPGPAQELRQPIRQITRGEVALFKVLSGFWVQATFQDRALGELITPRHTYKVAGGDPARLYPDSRFRTLVYETVESSSEISRFIVDNRQKVWRCAAPAPSLDLLEHAAYTTLNYQCASSTPE